MSEIDVAAAGEDIGYLKRSNHPIYSKTQTGPGSVEPYARFARPARLHQTAVIVSPGFLSRSWMKTNVPSSRRNIEKPFVLILNPR